MFNNTPTSSNFWQRKEGKDASLKGSSVYRLGNSEFEREVEVPYKDYLEGIKGGTVRKNFIRNKCLAYHS